MVEGINRTRNMYVSRGFTITNIHADPEFNCISNEMLPAVLNITAAREHVGEVERAIRTGKEVSRCITHTLPFKRIPILMVTSMVTASFSRLNDLPAPDGVSCEISPSTIVTGRPSPDYNVITSVSFGTYVQAHDEPDPTNDMTTRTTSAIALHPTGNEQGAYYFMSLSTGERINRRSWTELPMDNVVIARVEAMALAQDQPLLKKTGPLYEWRPGVPFFDTPSHGMTSQS